MRRLITWFLAAALVLFVSIQFVRPARSNPSSDPSGSLTASMRVPPDVQFILDRACRDCHSNETRWPWYSHVAPLSWFVVDHVEHGRSHFNYSRWRTYDAARRNQLLEATCEMAQAGVMPLDSYLLMHSEAKLTPRDVQALCAWTDAARGR